MSTGMLDMRRWVQEGLHTQFLSVTTCHSILDLILLRTSISRQLKIFGTKIKKLFKHSEGLGLKDQIDQFHQLSTTDSITTCHILIVSLGFFFSGYMNNMSICLWYKTSTILELTSPVPHTLEEICFNFHTLTDARSRPSINKGKIVTCYMYYQ